MVSVNTGTKVFDFIMKYVFYFSNNLLITMTMDYLVFVSQVIYPGHPLF